MLCLERRIGAKSLKAFVSTATFANRDGQCGLGALRFISKSAICLRREIFTKTKWAAKQSLGAQMALGSVWLGTQSIVDIVSNWGRMDRSKRTIIWFTPNICRWPTSLISALLNGESLQSGCYATK